MAKKNIFIFIHGMVLDSVPSSNIFQYQHFRQNLVSAEPSLGAQMNDDSNCVFVEYNHEIDANGGNDRDRGPDENLTEAEETIYNRVNYESVKSDSSDYNVTTSDDLGGAILGLAVGPLRLLTTYLRENILIRGLGDAVYYCSEEGESAVRRAVYGQVLKKLASFNQSNDDIALHIIAHSLGTTVAHDFLFGLFAPDSRWREGKPDFANDPVYGSSYANWRKRAQSRQSPRLLLGSMCSMASQIPLFLLRRQNVVDKFKKNEFLDPTDLGITRDGRIQWKIFYDVDDLLAFPTRRLYEDVFTIMDIQVDSGDDPRSAHIGYWDTREVIFHTAEMIKWTL